MTTDLARAKELRDQGIKAFQARDYLGARSLLEQSASLNMSDELTFLWLSAVLDSDEERRECLEHVLRLNPHNQAARNGLAKLAPLLEPAVAPAASLEPIAVAPAAAAYQPDSVLEALAAGAPSPPITVIKAAPAPAIAVTEEQLVDSLRISVRQEPRGSCLGRALPLIFVLGIVALLIALAATGMVPTQ